MSQTSFHNDGFDVMENLESKCILSFRHIFSMNGMNCMETKQKELYGKFPVSLIWSIIDQPYDLGKNAQFLWG